MFEYECPYCNSELKGSFGDNVYCEKCDITYETEWDYTDQSNMGAWLTGVEFIAKLNITDF